MTSELWFVLANVYIAAMLSAEKSSLAAFVVGAIYLVMAVITGKS